MFFHQIVYRTWHASVPCRGSISFYQQKKQKSSAKYLFPSPVGVLWVSILQILKNNNYTVEFSSPIGVLWVSIDGWDLSTCRVISVPCRGSISFYDPIEIIKDLLEISVPCRGSISFYQLLQTGRVPVETFPSPVGILWISICSNLYFNTSNNRFRPLSGFYEFLSMTNYEKYRDEMFPSPAGVLWVSIKPSDESLKIATSFRPLSGFYEFLFRIVWYAHPYFSFRPLSGFYEFLLFCILHLPITIVCFRPLSGFYEFLL